MNTQQRSVEAICDGTVIDHIPAGLGLVILRQILQQRCIVRDTHSLLICLIRQTVYQVVVDFAMK